MRIKFVNGTCRDINWQEFLQMLTHRKFVALVLSLLAAVIYVKPYEKIYAFTPIELTLFYASGFLSLMAALVVLVFLFQRRFPVVPTAAVLTLAVVLATLWNAGVAMLLGGPMPPFGTMVMILVFNLVFAFLGEMLLATFLFDPILADVRAVLPRGASAFAGAGAAPPKGDEPQLVTLLGEQIDSAKVLYLRADTHYVTVALADGPRPYLRGRISDAVQAMPADLGRMVHRSHWVAASAVQGARQEGRSLILQMADGVELPVARNRQQEVRDWLARYGKADHGK